MRWESREMTIDVHYYPGIIFSYLVPTERVRGRQVEPEYKGHKAGGRRLAAGFFCMYSIRCIYSIRRTN